MPLTTAKRTRRGTGAIDIDSDDITAAVDTASNNITLEPRLHTSKRPKVEHPRQTVNPIPTISEAQGNALPSDNIAQLEKDSPEDKKRKQVCFMKMSRAPSLT
jgi:hypothetical protein